MSYLDSLWKHIAACKEHGLLAVGVDDLRDMLDALPTCESGCAYYHPTEIGTYPDGCQFGRIRDSYPPDFFCGLFSTKDQSRHASLLPSPVTEESDRMAWLEKQLAEAAPMIGQLVDLLERMQRENEALKAINSRSLKVGSEDAADEIARLRADNRMLHRMLADFTGAA